MEELLCDQATAAQLATAGQRRAREFSWKRAAERTVDVYRRVWAESRS
jgi:hypothetical protein